MPTLEPFEIYVYGPIGPRRDDPDNIDTSFVMHWLAKAPKNRRPLIRINSPGGSVDEGVAIYNLLKNYPGGCDVIVDSLAASIASVIAMAGETITMLAGSRLMIHSPWSAMFSGNSREIRKRADLLDLYESSIIDIYRTRLKRFTKSMIADYLDQESWFGPTQAKMLGLCDRILDLDA